MSDIKCNCPQCGTHLAVDAAGAGMTVACPNCGLAILVPQLARLARQEPPRQAKRWWLLSAGIAVLALIAGLLIWQTPWRKTTAAGPTSVSLTDHAASRESLGNPRSANAAGEQVPSNIPGTAERLKRVKALYDQGLISKEDYDRKVKEISDSK